MTRKEVVDILNQFESEHPVDEWTVKGIHVWPMIKIDLFFRWLKVTDERYKKSSELFKVKKNNLFKKSYLTVISMLRLSVLLIKPTRKEESFFFLDSRSYRSKIDNKQRNRFYHSLVDYINHLKPASKMIYISDDSEYSIYPSDESIYFSSKYFHAIRLLSLFKKPNKVSESSHFDSLMKTFGEDGYKIVSKQHYKNEIDNLFNSILEQKYLIKTILRKENATLTFELCFYSLTRYAANIAARELNIETIEIQHGGMGPEHIAYSGWSKFPKEGYELMPKTIWLWDDASYNLIKKWTNKQHYHSCFLGGNPWISFLLNDSQNKYSSFPTDKKIILYTLQTHDIEPYLLETIASTPEEYQWWIRLHPGKLDARNSILAQIEERNLLDKVIIDKATNLPLPIILLNTSVHISAFSGSVIEAAMLGVFSILIDEIGVSNYQKQIQDGLAVAELSKDKDKLIEKIKSYPTDSIYENNNSHENQYNNYKSFIDNLLTS
ncbi:hypothetical protein CW751_01125 [Brumimicrobium salinarum]|uniref:Uncharacterized protein n=1 Tax=Brumimicrobium salinarum TaxID=2058658 RepID=A0A2I0R5X5_9FLAO|nr:hypothetical protein [Brumimicrobium salinarum]PKR81969.1 hypothetical protein CW751_01125 [Brumimicrobium salinarum]